MLRHQSHLVGIHCIRASGACIRQLGAHDRGRTGGDEQRLEVPARLTGRLRAGNTTLVVEPRPRDVGL